ncbi:conserved hypothetical protein [Histoplasma capsulatum H143]|uniref:Uncharacterized protein n=1 Tax=Ajellomyces capsulatus (strain H143) TaxID=544712 RepID=C6HGM5_AJECH|nr:conserved hypothetical protein [Histoplasma capsulatum H143]
MGKEWGNNGGPMPAMYHELICTIGAQADIQVIKSSPCLQTESQNRAVSSSLVPCFCCKSYLLLRRSPQGCRGGLRPWQSLLVMDGLAGDSHVETCSPRAFSGQRATILDPIEGSRGWRCQLSPSVSNNVLGLLSVTAKDDNHRWRRDSISETCTRNALVGLRQGMWIIERVGAAHDLRGGESPRKAADGLSTHKVIFDHTCTKPKNYRVHPRNAFSTQ